MERDFRHMPESGEGIAGSGPFEQRLIAWATEYAAIHAPHTFAGGWQDWSSGLAEAVAGFTADIERHRAALDPRIRVVERSRTLPEWQAAAQAVERLIASAQPAHLRPGTVSLELEAERLHVSVAVDDEAAFEAALAARLPGDYDLYFERWTMTPQTIRGWDVSADDEASLTVYWLSATDQDPARAELRVEEAADDVRLTLLGCMHDGWHRAASSTGPEMHFGYTLPGPEVCSVTVTLDAPWAGRRVVDTTRGRRPARGRPHIDW